MVFLDYPLSSSQLLQSKFSDWLKGSLRKVSKSPLLVILSLSWRFTDSSMSLSSLAELLDDVVWPYLRICEMEEMAVCVRGVWPEPMAGRQLTRPPCWNDEWRARPGLLLQV